MSAISLADLPRPDGRRSSFAAATKKLRKYARSTGDGWHKIRDAVKNDQCSINKAYDLIRDMELGEDEKKKRRTLSKAQIKSLKSMLSEENFVGLETTGDDLGSLLNLAVEQFIQRASG